MKRIHLTLAIGSLMAILAIGGVLLFGGKHGMADGRCGQSASVMHEVTIRNDKASPVTTEGKLCDTIRFTNEDKVAREIGFGSHEHHVPYDGIAERVLNKGQSFTITLDKPGTYHFHDHLHDEVEGYFSVSK